MLFKRAQKFDNFWAKFVAKTFQNSQIWSHWSWSCCILYLHSANFECIFKNFKRLGFENCNFGWAFSRCQFRKYLSTQLLPNRFFASAIFALNLEFRMSLDILEQAKEYQFSNLSSKQKQIRQSCFRVQFVLNGQSVASFSSTFCLFQTNMNKILKKLMWKMSIQYTVVLGFEPTTFRQESLSITTITGLPQGFALVVLQVAFSLKFLAAIKAFFSKKVN